MKTQRLVLFRHGDKKIENHSDPDLNPVGLMKAKKIPDWIEEGKLPMPEKLWCSNKKRTQQTLRPISDKWKTPLIETSLLTEAQPGETSLQFDSRIEKLVQSLFQEPSGTHFACSHYDWVIRFCEMGLGAQFQHLIICQHWRPCQYIDFQIEAENPEIKWKLQLLNSGVVT